MTGREPEIKWYLINYKIYKFLSLVRWKRMARIVSGEKIPSDCRLVPFERLQRLQFPLEVVVVVMVGSFLLRRALGQVARAEGARRELDRPAGTGTGGRRRAGRRGREGGGGRRADAQAVDGDAQGGAVADGQAARDGRGRRQLVAGRRRVVQRVDVLVVHHVVLGVVHAQRKRRMHPRHPLDGRQALDKVRHRPGVVVAAAQLTVFYSKSTKTITKKKKNPLEI